MRRSHSQAVLPLVSWPVVGASAGAAFGYVSCPAGDCMQLAAVLIGAILGFAGGLVVGAVITARRLLKRRRSKTVLSGP